MTAVERVSFASAISKLLFILFLFTLLSLTGTFAANYVCTMIVERVSLLMYQGCL